MAMPRIISNGKANGFPVAPHVAAAARSVTGGLPSGDAKVWVRPVKYYHKVDYRAPGPLNNQLLFFNVPRQFGVTNLDQPSTLPPNYTLALESVRLHFVYGIAASGFRGGIDGGAPTNAQALALSLNIGSAGAVITDQLASLWKANEKIREMFEMGIATFTISDRPVFEINGLTSFPSGRGVVASNSINSAMTAAAASNSIQQASSALANGVPVLSNRFEFQTPYPIPAGQTFGFKLQWPQAVDFTETQLGPLNGVATTNASAGVLTAGHWCCELEGQVFCPAN